jgi:hypothetical protein
MVLRKAWLIVGAMTFAGAVAGCREAAAPEPWEAAPVVVSAVDAASVTVRVEDAVTVTGPAGTEVGDKGNWSKLMPAELRTKLEASGFKVAAPGAAADIVASIQATDVDWTGRFWEARGAVSVVLTNPADQSTIGRLTAHFAGQDYTEVAAGSTTRLTDAALRSPELSSFVKAKRAKEEAAKAPPPPPTPPPPPPPPPPGLEPGVVRPVLAALGLKYRRCYESGVAKSPTLAGKAVLKVNIAPNGAIESVSADASSSLSDDAVVTCLMDVTKTASFPQAPGKTAHLHVLEFAPGAAPVVAKGGGLEPVAVHQGLHGVYDKILTCYETGLKKDPKLAGNFKLQFAVNPKGAVPRVEAAKDSTLKDPALKKCILGAVKSATFAQTKKQSNVTYLLELTPPG